jgi:hypothetical protein
MFHIFKIILFVSGLFLLGCIDLKEDDKTPPKKTIVKKKPVITKKDSTKSVTIIGETYEDMEETFDKEMDKFDKELDQMLNDL